MIDKGLQQYLLGFDFDEPEPIRYAPYIHHWRATLTTEINLYIRCYYCNKKHFLWNGVPPVYGCQKEQK